MPLLATAVLAGNQCLLSSVGIGFKAVASRGEEING